MGLLVLCGVAGVIGWMGRAGQAQGEGAKGMGVRDYHLTIEDMLIAPTDERGRAWDRFGAPTDLLQKERRKFDERTKELRDQQCWPNEDQRWVCVPTAKIAWIMLLPTLLEVFQTLEAIAREKKTYKPDARVTLKYGGQALQFAKYQDSYQPTWKQAQTIRLAPGDRFSVEIDDVDLLGSDRIAVIQSVFAPTPEAYKRGRFQMILNQALNVKHVVLQFVVPGAP